MFYADFLYEHLHSTKMKFMRISFSVNSKTKEKICMGKRTEAKQTHNKHITHDEHIINTNT